MALRPSLAPSAFQGGCRHPERVVVTHPFNPPHLIPLVEVVGGARTCEAAIEAAMAAMTRLGRSPIRLRAELPGHVVNRLQAALRREAYHLVGRGVVSVADLDAAVASGPGLRWALLGPIATQHLSGGPGGRESQVRAQRDEALREVLAAKERAGLTRREGQRP